MRAPALCSPRSPAAYTANEAELRGAYMQAVDPGLDRFAAAHAAFSTDGVFLYLPPGVAVADPFVIDIQGVSTDSVSFPHVTVVAERNSEASHRDPPPLGPGGGVGDGAAGGGIGTRRCEVAAHHRPATRRGGDHHRPSASRPGARRHRAARRGRFGRAVSAGSTSGSTCWGAGGTADVVGLYFGEHEQVLDYRLLIDHLRAEHLVQGFPQGCGRGRGANSVFTGMVKIEPRRRQDLGLRDQPQPGALAGRKANSVPNLEILCNDVICGHASSVGPLDEDQLYYLESRGSAVGPSGPTAGPRLLRGGHRPPSPSAVGRAARRR